MYLLHGLVFAIVLYNFNYGFLSSVICFLVDQMYRDVFCKCLKYECHDYIENYFTEIIPSQEVKR